MHFVIRRVEGCEEILFHDRSAWRLAGPDAPKVQCWVYRDVVLAARPAIEAYEARAYLSTVLLTPDELVLTQVVAEDLWCRLERVAFPSEPSYISDPLRDGVLCPVERAQVGCVLEEDRGHHSRRPARVVVDCAWGASHWVARQVSFAFCPGKETRCCPVHLPQVRERPSAAGILKEVGDLASRD